MAKLREMRKKKQKSFILNSALFKGISRFIKPKFQSVKNEIRLLFRSRIFLGMLSVPTMFLFYRTFHNLHQKYFSPDDSGSLLGYPADHPVVKFLKPRLSYWDRFRIWVASIVHSLLTDPSIEKEGLNFLDRTFRHDQTQEAGLSLLNNVLKDDRFMDEA